MHLHDSSRSNLRTQARGCLPWLHKLSRNWAKAKPKFSANLLGAVPRNPDYPTHYWKSRLSYPHIESPVSPLVSHGNTRLGEGSQISCHLRFFVSCLKTNPHYNPTKCIQLLWNLSYETPLSLFHKISYNRNQKQQFRETHFLLIKKSMFVLQFRCPRFSDENCF